MPDSVLRRRVRLICIRSNQSLGEPAWSYLLDVLARILLCFDNSRHLCCSRNPKITLWLTKKVFTRDCQLSLAPTKLQRVLKCIYGFPGGSVLRVPHFVLLSEV